MATISKKAKIARMVIVGKTVKVAKRAEMTRMAEIAKAIKKPK